jgi:hypothetical protein
MAKVAQLHDNLDRTRYFVLQRENVIGRAEDASIRYDNKTVSRRHARIAQTLGGSFYVEDISARGTYVNFERIQGRHPLREGDRICVLQFRSVHPLELSKMTPKDLKGCCDDPRNQGIKAAVDLTFGYAEVKRPEPQAIPQEEPKGLLAKVKSLFGKG